MTQLHTYVCLLRGINVGGHNPLAMADLRRLLADLKLSHVQSYIQTGNVIFESTDSDEAKLSTKIAEAIHAEKGFLPQVMCRHKTHFESIVNANPLIKKDSVYKPHHLYIFNSPSENTNAHEELCDLKSASEQFSLSKEAFYLYAPEGIGRSQMVAKLDTILGVPTTGRNWMTVFKISQLLG